MTNDPATLRPNSNLATCEDECLSLSVSENPPFVFASQEKSNLVVHYAFDESISQDYSYYDVDGIESEA